MAGRYNNIRLGLVSGLLAPLLGFVVVYLFAFRGMHFQEYIELLVYHKQLSAVISLSVIPNLLLFFIFIWLNYLYSARGVLASTIIFAGIVVVTKFLL
jgi:hypothetical protein